MTNLSISKKYKSKLDVPQTTKGQRHIFKKDTSFVLSVTKIRQMHSA